ncbi:MAG: hypothetical protein ACE5I8_12155, partial [Thermodesulfobacteriota bacterium]
PDLVTASHTLSHLSYSPIGTKKYHRADELSTYSSPTSQWPSWKHEAQGTRVNSRNPMNRINRTKGLNQVT